MTREQEERIRALAVEVELLEIEKVKNGVGYRAQESNDVALAMAEEFAVLCVRANIARRRLSAAIDEASKSAPLRLVEQTDDENGQSATYVWP